MDSITAMLVTFGTLLLLASWIQLLFTSFRTDFSWGLITLFLPFISYIYCLWAWEKSKDAWKAGALGSGLLLMACLA